MEKITKEQKEKFDAIIEELNVEAEDLEYIVDYGYDIETYTIKLSSMVIILSLIIHQIWH